MSRLSRIRSIPVLLFLVLLGTSAVLAAPQVSQVPDPVTRPETGEEVIVIAADWKQLYPFSARFPHLKARAGAHVIDLAAMRFATDGLVSTKSAGERRFAAPDMSSFSRALVRAPFEQGDSDLFIVQAASPEEQIGLRETLDLLGAEIVGYVPHNAYLVELTIEQHARLGRAPEVFWMGFYQPAWRVAPKLDYIAQAKASQPLRMTVLASVDHFPSQGALRRALRDAGVQVQRAVRRSGDWKARVQGMAGDAERLAGVRGVLWVERFVDFELFNNVARTSADTATGRGAVSGPIMDVEDVWTRGIRGEGQIVAVADTGLSTGNLSTLHLDFGDQGSPSNPMRVIQGYALGRATWDDDVSIDGGHGTHVAGSVVGNGFRSGSDPATNTFPSSSYAGTAPKAELVFQSIMDSGGNLGGIPNDLNDLFQTPYDDGARVHSNSWGAPVSGQYNANSQELDEFTWLHQDMLISFAAGNGGIDGRSSSIFGCSNTGDPIDGVIDNDSIGAPATAKNSLTVGASENYRPDFTYEFPEGDCTSSNGVEQKTWGWFNGCSYSVNPIFGDLMADNASGLGAFSSRGPTDDGRVKPDIVAPGISIISTRSDQNQAYEQWGICNVPVALRPYYLTQGGTSMANPLTAGTATLVRQYYVDGWHANNSSVTNTSPNPSDGFNPSAALVKATLLNGAYSMTPGQYGTGSTREIEAALPNMAEGYGRVDLEGALFPGSGFGDDPGRLLEVHDVSAGLTTGQSTNYGISIASSADPLIVTLVWTDPFAAAGSGAKLVNDLDVTVISPGGTTFYANGIDKTSGFDRTNNVEQVTVSAPATGDWTVRVNGFNVPGNAVAGSNVQPYALAISGVLGSAPPVDQPPVVSITSPTDGTMVNVGDSVTFTGSATDPEDGDVTASLAWTSSLDGAIGSGGSFSTSSLSIGSHLITATATDSASNTGSANVTVHVNDPNNNGPQNAVYDGGLGAPACAIAGSSCDSGTLLDGRHDNGPEPNFPNTLDTCTDGTSGTYHADESNDRIVVSSLTSSDLVEGDTVQVEATVWAWNTGSADSLDLYYAADATNPSWNLIGTFVPPGGGAQTITSSYTLPSGSLQAIRANFRWEGNASPCSGGIYDDADDLVFAVKPAVGGNTAPTVTITSPANGASVTVGDSVTFAGTASDVEDGDLSASLAWSSSIDGSIGSGASFSTSGLSEGVHTITASVTDSGGLPGSDSVILNVNGVGPAARLEWGTVNVGATPVTVSLTNTYTSAVVVAAVQYANNTTPVVSRVSNVGATSFDVRLQNPSGGAVATDSVSYLVVEEGVWTVDGVNLEAQKYTSTVTDRKNGWVGQSRTYGQSYTNPVVLGQVMSENDPNWSVFWSQGASRTSPPSASTLFTGKHVGEDPNVTRADETVGFVVIEAGHGTLGGVELEAALGADTVRGIGNGPPFNYAFNTAFTSAPAVGLVSLSAMDGGDGGWAQIHGTSMTATTLPLSVDEDQLNDTERGHTTEQVAYAVFAAPGSVN